MILPEREQTSDGSLFAREFGEPSYGGQANDGHDFDHDWCGLRLFGDLAQHRLGQDAPTGQKAADAYCKGCSRLNDRLRLNGALLRLEPLYGETRKHGS